MILVRSSELGVNEPKVIRIYIMRNEELGMRNFRKHFVF